MIMIRHWGICVGTTVATIIIITRLPAAIRITVIITRVPITIISVVVSIATVIVPITVIVMVLMMFINLEVKMKLAHPKFSSLGALWLRDYHMIIPSLHLAIKMSRDEFIFICREKSNLNLLGWELFFISSRFTSTS